MNNEILTILDSIEREKGIPKEVLFVAIESALLSAARKILGKHRTDITVTIDRKTGQISVTGGDKKIDSGEFGRIAAQTAKQVIIQKIREAEREIIFEDYHKRLGNIVTGSVHRFERGNIIVDLGKTEAILPRSEQCPNERYKQGDRIRCLLLEVTMTNRGPQIVLSRSSVAFVKKLFELEVPEISEGIVEIKSISREPSERTKIAVYSKDEKIDPVGASVGMRGNRVKDIVRELHGEKIDIVRWNKDISEYLKAALSPAEISKIQLDKERKSIDVIVKNDQLSIAIGKHGQNVRLASKLIGWELNIKSAEEKEPKGVLGKAEGRLKRVLKSEAGGRPKEVPRPEEVPHTTKKVQGRAGHTTKKVQGRVGKKALSTGRQVVSVKSLDGVGKKAESTLLTAGFDAVEKIARASANDLVKLDGIGRKTAEKIIASAKEKLKGAKE